MTIWKKKLKTIVNNKENVKEYFKDFKREIPLKLYYIKFTFRNIKDEGLCYGPYIERKTGKKYILIVINQKNSFNIQLNALMHEYAHCLYLDRGFNYTTAENAHGVEWGKCYSEVYRVFLKINKP